LCITTTDEAAKAFSRAILPILALETGKKEAVHPPGEAKDAKARNLSRFAVPVAGGRLCAHFGHCETFVLLDVDEASKTIVGRQDIEAPPHEPGLLPRWLQERGATTIIAGGMGSRARGLFDERGIRVIVGPPRTSRKPWCRRTCRAPVTGENVCDH
jgi:predicted Fe-Mo cluster-binding NifX family protein